MYSCMGISLLLILCFKGSYGEESIDLEPGVDKVPEKVEHGEEGSAKYNINTVTLTGNKATGNKVTNDDKRPPWPPRPGKRTFRPQESADTPSIFRPGRSVHEDQLLFRPGRANLHKRQGLMFRPGRREDVPKPQIFRPGRREDIPSDDDQLMFRPGRNEEQLFRPGRRSDVGDEQLLFRPGRRSDLEEDQLIFRPGRRSDVAEEQLFRPGRRSDVPEAFLDQWTSVRPGRGGYRMPWTYTGNSVNSHVSQKSHTFRQKAVEQEKKKREV
ncbi:uncharacterized protein LOC116615992 [Nematostella vectensis]|uniref:uncharacterized protein LOC116615992 n=1 Tax=Nematostella vectensis TaxID=45351 RepID=UPI0013905EC8|nr:uncharacterized protein LOC116615992 [Nematostella vectensis]